MLGAPGKLSNMGDMGESSPIGGGGNTPEPGSPWILASNVWNDSGVWDDTAAWKD